MAEFWFTLGFALFVLAAAVVLIVLNVRTWRIVRSQEGIEERERNYHARQFRRRIQCSIMLGLLGVAVFVGHFLRSPPLKPWAFVLYWAGVVLVVVWVGLLAALDLAATRLYYGRLRHYYLLEQTRLQVELRRLAERDRNGRG